MGYSFNSTELMDAIKNNKNILNKDQLLNVVGASSLDNLKLHSNLPLFLSFSFKEHLLFSINTLLYKTQTKKHH